MAGIWLKSSLRGNVCDCLYLCHVLQVLLSEEAIGRTLATLDKYKNRIREIQKKELEAEYGTDIQEEFSSQASAEIPPSNTQQQMDFNALLNGLVNAKRVF